MVFTETSDQNFRHDVQGLRGIAVLSVVIYHADFLLPGGFVGVDIFFVISGYVITKSLLREFAAYQKINVGAFISRRIKRLLPALSTMSVCTLALTVFIMSPFGEQQQVAKTAVASSLFGANMYLAIQDSYFALINNPFRHTWSLAVEEQFYLFFILMIATIQKVFVKRSSAFLKSTLVVISMISLTSFVLSSIMSLGHHLPLLPVKSTTRIAFFGMPTRIWEFGVGIVLALYEKKNLPQGTRHKAQGTKISANAISLIGIILIGYSLLKFNSFTTFPGFSAVLPVLGSGLLIMDRSSNGFARRILVFRPMIWLGNISYSWYLWHWPLIVFARILWPGNSGLIVFFAFASLLPAFLSYRFIENQFRLNSISKKNIFSTLKIFTISTCAPIAASLAVFLGASSGYGLNRPSGSELQKSLADNFGCQIETLPVSKDKCFFETEPESTTVLLIGDSQASTFSDPIAAAAKSLNLNFAVRYSRGCPIFPRPTVERPGCQIYLNALPGLIEHLNPEIIVIANATTLYTTSGPLIGGLTITKSDGRTPSTYHEAIETWVQGFETMLKNSDFTDRKILVINQVPPARFLNPSIIRPNVSTKAFDLNSLSDRNLLVAREKLAIENRGNVFSFDTADFLCPKGKCEFSINGKDLYEDQLHLTVEGAMLLTQDLKTVLLELIK